MSTRLIAFAGLLATALGQMVKSTVGDGINISVAIPDVEEGPFDVLVKITAPAGTGWAAVSWGGQMLRSPLSIAWPSDDGVMVSSRWAETYTLPKVYDGASNVVFSTSEAGDDGWTATFLCTGCSEWRGGSLDPNAENEFAWAYSTRAVFSPENIASVFAHHDDRAQFSVDLSKAKLSADEWDSLLFEMGQPVSGDVEEVEDEPEEDDEDEPDKMVDEPADEPADEPVVVDKPVVKTSVIVLNPPAETPIETLKPKPADDVDDEPEATPEDRTDRIPRPTFMPIPEEEEDDDVDEEPADNPDRIPRPTFLPAPGDDVGEPDEEIDDAPDDVPGKIPRPTFLPAPDNESGMRTSTVRAAPKPSLIPDMPFNPPEEPDRIPRPVPRPIADEPDDDPPTRTRVPDAPFSPEPYPWEDDEEDDPYNDWDYTPAPPPAFPAPSPRPVPVAPTPVTPPWGSGPPPFVTDRGRGRFRGRPGRGRGRGRGG